MKLTAVAALIGCAMAQDWDLPASAAGYVETATGGRLKISAELRARYEIRSANAFGHDPDIDTGLVRMRFGLSYRPASWIRFSGMLQDCRAPWYGENAPNTARDPVDLHEAYVELFPEAKSGFGLSAGRRVLAYGDGRLIGESQWINLSRTYDHLRLFERTPFGRFEVLLTSAVKVRIGEFNRPELGDRVWGTYNVLPNALGPATVELYYLRHDQNRPGGYTGGSRALGTDRLGTNTYGARVTGPAWAGAKFVAEAALQNGHIGPAAQSAAAWASTLTRQWQRGSRTFEALAEYKFASGTANPSDARHSSTFDQLYAANHDKFGHEDLIGWRNLHNVKGLARVSLRNGLAANFMYNSSWLATARDGLYNGSGKLIAQSASGAAGRFVGQEADVFLTYKYRHFTLGAGYGRLFDGEFLRKTTPGRDPNYVYVFHTYSL